MFSILLQMWVFIFIGYLWRYFSPDRVQQQLQRKVLIDLVFYIFLPALVLNTIWIAPLGQNNLFISTVAAFSVIVGLTSVAILSRLIKLSRPQRGVLFLASSFPNTIYLGLPVLNEVSGAGSHLTVLQYELLGCTPILLTLGIIIAHRHGEVTFKINPLRELVSIPPLWALSLGASLNFLQIPQSRFIEDILNSFSSAVIPLMLMVLGMSIQWRSLHLRYFPQLLIITLISLVIVPFSVYFLTTWFQLEIELIQQLVIISAMPTIVFGIILCDRYKLDSELYAAAVAVTSLLSLLSLPLWFHFLWN